jgi:hypothetical protein
MAARMIVHALSVAAMNGDGLINGRGRRSA